ncbi:hypothetical protein DFH27DRAFT_523192 [Peziza echinospora]|nr:hypothetical protein DFH27DRAFT_523192 [Peziza echinospora]
MDYGWRVQIWIWMALAHAHTQPHPRYAHLTPADRSRQVLPNRDEQQQECCLPSSAANGPTLPPAPPSPPPTTITTDTQCFSLFSHTPHPTPPQAEYLLAAVAKALEYEQLVPNIQLSSVPPSRVARQYRKPSTGLSSTKEVQYLHYTDLQTSTYRAWIELSTAEDAVFPISTSYPGFWWEYPPYKFRPSRITTCMVVLPSAL